MKLISNCLNKYWYLKDNFKRLFRELSAYQSYYFKSSSPEQIRLIIFAQGRTGSTLLEDLIGSTNCFSVNGELLSALNSPFRRKPFSPMRYLIGLSRKTHENFIFHVKITHLIDDLKVDPNDFLKTLWLNGWKIIYLKRINKINIVLSNYIAENRGQYHKFNNQHENIQLSVDCDAFCKKIRNRINYDRLDEDALRDIDHCNLIYEEDLEDEKNHQKTIDKVFDYLSLEHKRVLTKHKKINTYQLQELLVNYDEFLECIHNNGFDNFL